MAESISFSLDGDRVVGVPGDTIAAALLRSGVTTFTRSIKYHRPRGPFCLSGSCGQCLLRVDGVPSLPACRVRVEEGMACERQNGPLGVEADLLRATDFLFPTGLDHHHLLVQSRLLGRVALEVARRLAGLGELPVHEAKVAKGELRTAPLVVIGAGPAGLAAARVAGAKALLIERDERAGGAALLGIDPAGPDAAWVASTLHEFPGALLTGAEAVGLYPNDSGLPGNGLLAVRLEDKLLAIAVEKVIVATGGAPQPVPFPGVDRPGVHAARGLLKLHAECGVRVGARIAVVGDGKELVDCARALRRAGYELARVVSATRELPPAEDLPLVVGAPLRALGDPVRALEIAAAGGGAAERIGCDAVALAWAPAPLHELASSNGAAAAYLPELNGSPLVIDKDGRTTVPWIFAAGRACGLGGAGAVPSGEAAAAAACK